MSVIRHLGYIALGYDGFIINTTTMEASNYILKITGSIELSEGQASQLKMQSDYSMEIKGSIVKSEDYDKQDGTVIKRYTLKIADAEFDPYSII